MASTVAQKMRILSSRLSCGAFQIFESQSSSYTDRPRICYIHRVDWNKLTKGHEKFSGKVALGVVIMQGVPKIFGALRGHLCDSIAFLFLYHLHLCIFNVVFL